MAITATDLDVKTLLPNTHISPETAYIVENYPYGGLRCTMRYWLEYTPKKGFRLWSQTTNPKRGNIWNKPKASTFARFGGAMYLDSNGHCKWHSLSEYSDSAESQMFLEIFKSAIPLAGLQTTLDWAEIKAIYQGMVDSGIPWQVAGSRAQGEFAVRNKRAPFSPVKG
jgi:hypothetical protein